ncbi:hypothetical protein [Streptomyces hawaiiensis]|uniref:hypothetical protein n=1 Tax=Streptomyces hawaiiensis TaxID=67305 RepID=UPI0036693B86
MWTLASRAGARVAEVAAVWCDAFGVVACGRVQLNARQVHLRGLNVFKSGASIASTALGAMMRDKETARPGATGMWRSAGLISMSLLWATVIAVSPWLPSAVGILDLTGLTAILSMLICGLVPSLLLGTLLGRARACRLLAMCGVAGPALWILDFTVFSDPDVHSSHAVAVAFAGALALGLISAPLMGGAVVGRYCRRHCAAQ